MKPEPVSFESQAVAGEIAPAGSLVGFHFHHKVFGISGAYFELDADRCPVLRVRLGDMQVSISINQLRSEFALEEETDGKLVELVEKGLQFVRVIRPGDDIPAELLDGRASWPVEERHLMAARRRVGEQLKKLAKITVVDSDDSDTPEKQEAQFQNLVKEAANEAARQLGLPPERKQEVLGRIDAFAAEYAYIEALRERVGHINRMRQSAERLTGKKKSELSADLLRINHLMRAPLANFREQFDNIEAQTAEIMGVLKNFDAQVAYVREVRDRVHAELLLWEDLPEKWAKLKESDQAAVIQLVRATYGFLARNYNESQSWIG